MSVIAVAPQPTSDESRRTGIDIFLIELPPLLEYGVRCLLQADVELRVHRAPLAQQVPGSGTPVVALVHQDTISTGNLRALQSMTGVRTLALATGACTRPSAAVGSLVDVLLPGDVSPRQLVESVYDVTRRHSASTRGDESLDLTPREREVLALLRGRRTNEEIGSELFLAHQTVKNYVRRVMGKLGCSSRTELYATTPVRN